MQTILIGKAAAFPNPGRKVVEVEGVSVGVFCRDGKFTAFENVCPHMGGPVCRGKIIARVQELIAADKTSLGLAFSKDQTNVACPWHGYELHIVTRQPQGNPPVGLRPLKIEVVDGDLVVTLPEGTRDRIARRRSQRPREAS